MSFERLEVVTQSRNKTREGDRSEGIEAREKGKWYVSHNREKTTMREDDSEKEMIDDNDTGR